MKLVKHWVRFGRAGLCPQLRCKGRGEILAPLNRLEDPYLFFCTSCARVLDRQTGKGVTTNVTPAINKGGRVALFRQMRHIKNRPKYGWEGELLNEIRF